MQTLLSILILSLALASCEIASPRPAIIWTDSPDIVTIAELYNASQPRYTVEIHYKATPIAELASGKGQPDIIISAWLKDSRNRRHFVSLDDLFEDRIIHERSFYPKLLAQGNFASKQYLLPVSFNIPTFVFSQEQGSRFPAPFVLTPQEARIASTEFTVIKDGAAERLGYSPRWDNSFIMALSTLMGVQWQEGDPLDWQGKKLEQSLQWLREWTLEANTSALTEDEFTFKYLNEPRTRLLSTGRILLSVMGTRELFTLKSEQRNQLDFRWISQDEVIPVQEDSIWLGICRRGRARSPARDFIRWFYREDSWQAILEFYQKTRMGDSVFGVGNGFSALQPVNEKIYPQFYPALLGHIPPADFLRLPEVLPGNWSAMRDSVVLPWIREALASEKLPPDSDMKAAVRNWSLEYRRIGD